MGNGTWNPWKLTTIGLLLVLATALVTGIVVANWSGTSQDAASIATPPPAPAPTAASKPATKAVPTRTAAAARPSAPTPPPAPGASPAPVQTAASSPSSEAIEACNRYAAGAPTTGDKTVEVVKDAAIGALVGAAVGAAGGAIADGGRGAGKGAMIGGGVGVAGGVLYGINENRKNDQKYRDAYAACMRSRGYAG